MNIIIKKHFLFYKGYKLKCSIGKSGLSHSKKEGDLTTPKGLFKLGLLYYRKDRNKPLKCKIKKKIIKRNMGWCNDSKNKFYNKEVNVNKNIKHEKLFRKDYKYDYVIPINYNTKNIKVAKGSAIFIHLSKNYKKTAGCIALKKKDLLILLKIINRKTKIKIL